MSLNLRFVYLQKTVDLALAIAAIPLAGRGTEPLRQLLRVMRNCHVILYNLIFYVAQNNQKG